MMKFIVRVLNGNFFICGFWEVIVVVFCKVRKKQVVKERKNLASGIMFKGMGNRKPVYGWGWKRKSKDEF